MLLFVQIVDLVEQSVTDAWFNANHVKHCVATSLSINKRPTSVLTFVGGEWITVLGKPQDILPRFDDPDNSDLEPFGLNGVTED